jgi:hypothetical protein
MSAPSGILDRVLGVRALSTGGEGVSITFAHAWPLWAWLLIGVACVGVALWSYSRLTGAQRWRWTLAGLRALTLLLLAVLIAGPQLEKQNERVERDWVVMMVDRSGSMGVADVEGIGGAARRATRDEQLRRVLSDAAPAFDELARKRGVAWLGFDAGAFELPISGVQTPEGVRLRPRLDEPSVARTALGASLEQALRRHAAKPIAGVVVLSDGRSFDAPSRATIQQLQERQVPLFVVALGSASAQPDAALARVDAPGAAFAGDLIPVTVDVEAQGAEGALGAAGLRGRLQLVDARGIVLDERELAPGTASQRVTLSARGPAPEEQGPGDDGGTPSATTVDWSVRLVLDEPDLSQENNAQAVRIEVASRPIRVLYLDGSPRWEYRYLKNLLLRERSIRSTATLLASDRRYIQEGTDRIDALPRTLAEWQPFDVVILGDLRPALLTNEAWESLREHVAERGAGVLWIGGEGFTPGAWLGTPLEDLLPFAPPSRGDVGVRAFASPVLLGPGPAADAYAVLQLGERVGDPWPEALSDASLGWPVLRWAQRIEPAWLKPSAETLAVARGASSDEGASPLVMTMRFGAGRSVYVATDETWRYRYGRGEALPERFWIPLVRMLARGSLGRTGKPALLEASPTTALVNQPVRVTLRLIDQSLIEKRPASVALRVSARPPEGAAGGVSSRDGVELVLRPEGAQEAGAPVATFAALWIPDAPGLVDITPTEPLLAGLDLGASVRVVAPEDEMRRPQADHEALANLAQETGGKVLATNALATLPEVLPNRELRLLAAPTIETLWDKPIVLIALLALLAAEWIGRRLLRLA